MFKQLLLTSSFIIAIFILNNLYARDYIEVVGSSTVFPFATVVAETFGKRTGLPTPKIESTGSGGGIKLFCKGDNIRTPDIVNVSRRIKAKEYQKCRQNGVTDITEVLVGFDGIVIANSKYSQSFNLRLRDLYLALAAKVPATAVNSKWDKKEFIKNPFTHWNQINQALPAVKIKVLGPPPTSGTRDALQELAIEGGCKTYAFMATMKNKNHQKYKQLCRTIREDGHFVEMGENDNLIISKLMGDKSAFGIFGFSFLEQNADKVKGLTIDGKAITFDNIASGDYPISRPLYFYIKNSHRHKIKGLNEFIVEFVDEDTFGEEGYLVDKGLIPSSEEKRKQFADDAIQGKNLKLNPTK